MRRRVQQDPTSIAFAQLAEECRRCGRTAEAVETCRAGLVRHPDFLSARVTLGRALTQLGALDEAEHELRHVVANAPGNRTALRALAEVRLRRGATADALALYRAALVLAPNDPELECAITDLVSLLERAARAVPQADGERMIAALEQFLAAIHVTRAQPRA